MISGDNASHTQELQKQECILILREAEAKDKAWEGLVSDKGHLLVSQSATMPLMLVFPALPKPYALLVNLSYLFSGLMSKRSHHRLCFSTQGTIYYSLYNNPRGLGQLSSRGQRQVTEI